MTKDDFIYEFFNTPIWNTSEKIRKEKIAVLKYFLDKNPNITWCVPYDVSRVLLICSRLSIEGMLDVHFDGWVSSYSITEKGKVWLENNLK